MQCEIRGMADIAEAGRPPPENMPKRGRVNEVRREWLVHEDGALAYKLQKEEVEQHYTGNKSRNAVVRLDTPLARSEQEREAAEALAARHQRALEQEQYDAQVARQLAARMEREERLRRAQREQRDEEMARQLQVRPAAGEDDAVHPLMACSTHVEREQARMEREKRERERLDAELAHQAHQQQRPSQQPAATSAHWQMPQPSRSPAQLPPLTVSPGGGAQAQPQAQPLPPRQPKPGSSPTAALGPLYSPPPPVGNVRAYPKPGAVSGPGASSPTPPVPHYMLAEGAVGGVGAAVAQDPAAAAAAVFGAHLAHTPPRAARQPHAARVGFGDANAVGLPCEQVAQQIRQLNLTRHSQQTSDEFAADLFEEEARRLQEEKDAELARQLQEQEELEGPEGLHRDRLLAIEAQDEELARMLQEKEKAKLRRARERAKQKALLKKQQEQQLTEAAGPSGSGTSSPLPLQPAGEDEEGCYSLPHQGSPSPPAAESPTKTSQLKGRRRFPDPEAIEEIPSTDDSPPGSLKSPGNSDALRNIAIVIDPTYPRRSPQNVSDIRTSPVITPSGYAEDDGTNSAPPYMPIQGQRRTASLEKKSKRKAPKDGCKQQ